MTGITQGSTIESMPSPRGGMNEMVQAIRGCTRVPGDWGVTAQNVADAMSRVLPGPDEVLALIPANARNGAETSQVLHVEPDGSFSVVALVTKPLQATTIHDHTTWCAVAVIEGYEREERFAVTDGSLCRPEGESRIDGPGTVSGFAPPGDVHRVTNAGEGVGISIHVYGTDISRIGNSVRRTYVLDRSPSEPEPSRG
jgi:predicted metal-dependent enzyme (double-stranded beta helix superfamily)